MLQRLRKIFVKLLCKVFNGKVCPCGKQKKLNLNTSDLLIFRGNSSKCPFYFGLEKYISPFLFPGSGNSFFFKAQGLWNSKSSILIVNEIHKM